MQILWKLLWQIRRVGVTLANYYRDPSIYLLSACHLKAAKRDCYMTGAGTCVKGTVE